MQNRKTLIRSQVHLFIDLALQPIKSWIFQICYACKGIAMQEKRLVKKLNKTFFKQIFHLGCLITVNVAYIFYWWYFYEDTLLEVKKNADLRSGSWYLNVFLTKRVFLCYFDPKGHRFVLCPVYTKSCTTKNHFCKCKTIGLC